MGKKYSIEEDKARKARENIKQIDSPERRQRTFEQRQRWLEAAELILEVNNTVYGVKEGLRVALQALEEAANVVWTETYVETEGFRDSREFAAQVAAQPYLCQAHVFRNLLSKPDEELLSLLKAHINERREHIATLRKVWFLDQ